MVDFILFIASIDTGFLWKNRERFFLYSGEF